MIRQALFLLAAAATMPAAAAEKPDVDRDAGAPLVAAFEQRCFGQPNHISAIIASNNADQSLQSIAVPSEFVDKKIDHVAAWTLTIGQRSFELIMLHRPEFKNSGIQCMLRSPDQRDAIFPYVDPFERTVKAHGIKPKQIDLPNLLIARGKIEDGRSAEARLLTKFTLPKWRERYITLWALYA